MNLTTITAYFLVGVCTMDAIIKVSNCYSHLQSLQKLSMSDYDVTLGARVHTNSVPTAAQAVQSNEVNVNYLYSFVTY